MSLKIIRQVALASIIFPTGFAEGQEVSGLPSSKEPFTLGVQTHFSQGWNLDALALLPGLGTVSVRDEVGWNEIEPARGVYDLGAVAPYLTELETAGLKPLILFTGSNPNYDGGKTPYTDEGRRAFARYVTTVIDAYPHLVKLIEIGNEYNTDTVDGPFRENMGYFTGELIKSAVPIIKEKHPETTILCTGAHSVSTGFFREVFETGALEYCDGISLHPYREQPEHLDVELLRLRALVREFGGGDKPLHVTEFGKWFDSPDNAPDFLLKMVSIMGASGVSAAYWYALFNEEWWPNMGLYAEGTEELPAAAAFRFVQTRLISLGRPVAKGTIGEDHVYEFGQGGTAFVVWGAPGELLVDGPADYFDSAGHPIDPVNRLSARPVIIIGDHINVTIKRERRVYSAYYGHGSEPWGYFAVKPNGEEVPFDTIDWNWNPYLGDPHLNPMMITSTTIEGAMLGGEPYYAVERFTAPIDGNYEITAQWSQDEPEGEGADVLLSVNGETIARGIVGNVPYNYGPVSIGMQSGENIDFAVGPGSAEGGDTVRRVITIKAP